MCVYISIYLVYLTEGDVCCKMYFKGLFKDYFKNTFPIMLFVGEKDVCKCPWMGRALNSELKFFILGKIQFCQKQQHSAVFNMIYYFAHLN